VKTLQGLRPVVWIRHFLSPLCAASLLLSAALPQSAAHCRIDASGPAHHDGEHAEVPAEKDMPEPTGVDCPHCPPSDCASQSACLSLAAAEGSFNAHWGFLPPAGSKVVGIGTAGPTRTLRPPIPPPQASSSRA
jgi:hypothetical protein